MDSNWFAYSALFAWPIITLIFYQRMPVVRATLWSILGASLLLPAKTIVDLPLFPPLGKETISNVSAFFVCRFILGKRIPLLPRLGLGKFLLLVYIVSPFITAFLNSDPVVAGPKYIKGLDYYDALSAVIRQLLFVLPFFLGFSFIRDSKSHEELLRVLVYAGLYYSLPMLFEVRFSPQLHIWVYGYFPHSFAQQIRGGGFRPVVFLGHGLWVAFFAMSSIVATSVYWKLKKTIFGISAGAVTLYMGIVLVLCKTLGALIYAILLVSLIRFTTPAKQVRFARILVILVMMYPMFRVIDLFPFHAIPSVVAEFSEERAESFQFRLDNEEELLAHARKKALFGWGNWGRNFVYDMRTGKNVTVTDGRWIIVIGELGWIGFLAEFGLLVLPVIRCAKVIRYVEDKRERIILGAISLLLAISVVDLLPNASVTPWTWLLVGALYGRVENIKSLVFQRRNQIKEEN